MRAGGLYAAFAEEQKAATDLDDIDANLAGPAPVPTGGAA